MTEIARIFVALDLPLEKLLGLYLGFFVVKEISFVFNYEETYELMGDHRELIYRYITIRERKDTNEYFANYKEIQELDDNESDKEIKKIEEVFVKKLISVL